MIRPKLACTGIYSSGDYFRNGLTFHGQSGTTCGIGPSRFPFESDRPAGLCPGACTHACMSMNIAAICPSPACAQSHKHPPPSPYTGRRLNPSSAHHLASLPGNPARPHQSLPGSPVRLPRHLQSSGLPNWPHLHLPVPPSPPCRHLPAPQSPRPALRLLRPSSSPIPPSSALPRSRCVTYYRLADDQTTSLLCATLVHYPR